MRDSSLRDAELVELACSGEVEAFGELISKHQGGIYNSVFHLVGRHQDAEDIAQEVFLKAYRSIGAFQRKAAFGTWLFGIMLNTVRSFWRKEGRRAAVLRLNANPGDEHRTLVSPESGLEGPLEMTARTQEVQQVRDAIGELEEELKEILVLRDIEGLSYERIARLLEVPLGTVKSRLYRARRSLKEKLQPVFEKRFSSEHDG